MMIKARTKKFSVMSSEEEATAANVLSQMSQIQQISCETIEATVINVGHHCDVETTATQGFWNFFVVVCRVIINEGLVNGKCKTLQEDDTSDFLCEPKTLVTFVNESVSNVYAGHLDFKAFRCQL